MSRRAYFWLIAIGGCVAAIAGGLYMFLRDEPPPDDLDLLSFQKEVADEANGFLLLQLSDEDVFWPPEEQVAELIGEEADDGEGWPDPSVVKRLVHSGDDFDVQLAKQVLARNEAVLRRFDESLARSDFLTTELPRDRKSLPVTTLQAWKQLVAVVSLRSRLHLEAGNDAEALEDALRLLRFGKKLMAAQGPLFDYAMGSVFHRRGSDLILYLSPRLHARPEILKKFIGLSNVLYPEPSALADAYRAEYAYFSEVCSGDDAVAGLPGSSWEKKLWRLTFKPNRARRLLAEEIRIFLREAPKPAAERNLPDPERYGTSVPGPSPILSGGSMVPIEVLRLCSQTLVRHDLASLRLSAARVMLGLKCWHTAHKSLPNALDALVPEYLDGVPADPFDGKALRYSREEKMLHSVGWKPGPEPETEFTFPIKFAP